jgi:hypothetical protein
MEKKVTQVDGCVHHTVSVKSRLHLPPPIAVKSPKIRENSQPGYANMERWLELEWEDLQIHSSFATCFLGNDTSNYTSLEHGVFPEMINVNMASTRKSLNKNNNLFNLFNSL